MYVKGKLLGILFHHAPEVTAQQASSDASVYTMYHFGDLGIVVLVPG